MKTRVRLDEDDPQTQAGAADAPSLREHGAAVLMHSLTRMLSHAEGVRQAADAEAVHQMRVWSRHTRAALETFHPCFRGKAFAEVERDVRAIADVLGEARDLDVMIEALGKRAGKLPPEQRGGVTLFIERLIRRRGKSQKRVLRALDQLERQDPVRRLRASVDGPLGAKRKARHG